MSTEETYPDPSSELGNAGSGPFYSQNKDSSSLLNELSSQLQRSAQRVVNEDNEHEQQGGYPNTPQRYGPAGSHLKSHDNHADPHYPSAEDMRPATDHNAASGSNIAEDALRAAHQSQQENQALAHHMMGLDSQEDPNVSMQGDDGQLPPRAKRNKVSRACDECRRKKIRCDASETEPQPVCSNCRRTGAQCRFSRTPMKRGPSKGYIKELADKINTLESRLGPPQYGNPPQAPMEGYGGPYGQVFDQDNEPGSMEYPSQSRKRTLSDANGANGGQPLWDSTYTPGRQGSSANMWASQDRLPPISHGASSVHTPSGGWRYGGTDADRRDSEAIREAATGPLPGWDDAIVDGYYRIIHQTFPLLPHSRSRLRARLMNCPHNLREVFLVSLDCCIRSSPHTNYPPSDLPQRAKRASELIASCQYDNMATRTLSSNLIYLQCLILMAFESDNHGPATMRGQAGPPRSEWLGRAIGMATHLKLHGMTGSSTTSRFDTSDPDGDERLGRRAWWILFILDRWHACSTSCLLQLPENSSYLGAEDQILLGEATWHLARLSHILGHLNLILHSPPELMSPTSQSSPIISTTILGEISRFRESVESLLLGSPNLVHLCYYHVRLLIHRLTATSQHYDLQELLVPSVRMARILNQRATGITPLNHHFAALAASTLIELSEFEECRDAAREGLCEIEEAIGGRKGLQSREDSQGWDSVIRIRVVEGLRRLDGERDRDEVAREGGQDVGGGLQQLADVAAGSVPGGVTIAGVGEKEGEGRARLRSEEVGGGGREYDPTSLIRYGYLAALVREEVR